MAQDIEGPYTLDARINCVLFDFVFIQERFPLIMKIRPDCVPCLMKRVLFQARLANDGCESRSVQAALNEYARVYSDNQNSAYVATCVHRAAYAELKTSDPYLELKIRADAVASEYLDYARKFVAESKDRFSAAMLISVIGNIMDFGSGNNAIDDPDTFRDVFEKLVSDGIGSDDTKKIKKILDAAHSVVYIFDNCGESQFDKVLIEEIHSMGIRVVGVVRGEPILNDVTKEDAERIGLDKILDAIYGTNQFAIGLDLTKIKDDLWKEIFKSDLIIAKGMANYESLTGQKVGIPVAHILRSKCIPVSESLNVPLGINVVRLRENA